MLKYMDLFSGGGGFAFALQHVASPVLYCEKDPFAQRLLLARMRDGTLPDAPLLSNIACLHETVSVYNQADMIVAGFPCPGMSRTGKRAGFLGEHGWIVLAYRVGIGGGDHPLYQLRRQGLVAEGASNGEMHLTDAGKDKAAEFGGKCFLPVRVSINIHSVHAHRGFDAQSSDKARIRCPRCRCANLVTHLRRQ